MPLIYNNSHYHSVAIECDELISGQPINNKPTKKVPRSSLSFRMKHAICMKYSFCCNNHSPVHADVLRKRELARYEKHVERSSSMRCHTNLIYSTHTPRSPASGRISRALRAHFIFDVWRIGMRTGWRLRRRRSPRNAQRRDDVIIILTKRECVCSGCLSARCSCKSQIIVRNRHRQRQPAAITGANSHGCFFVCVLPPSSTSHRIGAFSVRIRCCVNDTFQSS